MQRIGLGACFECDELVAVYRGRDGNVKAFRHGAAGLYGGMLRVPKCHGSYRPVKWAKDDAHGDPLAHDGEPPETL